VLRKRGQRCPFHFHELVRLMGFPSRELRSSGPALYQERPGGEPGIPAVLLFAAGKTAAAPGALEQSTPYPGKEKSEIDPIVDLADR
jgi:hypothetical protein